MAAICFGFFAVTIRMQMENQLHKIDLFHANINYFIVLRKKTNLCRQFSYFICNFAMSFRVLLFYSCSTKIRGISDMA